MKINNYLLLCMIIFLLSCSGKGNQKELVLSIPEHVEIYNPFLGKNLNTALVKTDKLKIYTLVDVSCSTCILKLEKWNGLYTKFKNVGRVEILPICYSKDKFELIRFLFETNKISKMDFPLILDTQNSFIKKNAALINKTGELTVLTDASNHILLSGNPVENGSDEEAFIKRIKDLQ